MRTVLLILALALGGCAATVKRCEGKTACGATASLLFGAAVSADRLGPLHAANVANARARASRLGLVQAMEARWINRLAIDSDAIVVELDGTQYWFFRTAAHFGGYPPLDSWIGETSAGDRLQIDQSISNMVGSFNIG